MQPFIKTKQCIAIKEPKYPVCHKCVEYEMESGLKERKPTLISNLKKQFNKFKEMTSYSNNLRCSICNKQKNECYFCFRSHIYQWVKKTFLNYPPALKLTFSR